MTLLIHLALTHFRNYEQLELDLDSRLTLLQGDNAQGKTNLLEAIYLLATSKPVHAQMEREVVDWRAQEEPIPYCRVAAQVLTSKTGRERPLELEIIYVPRADGVNFSKQVKINGVNRRSMDLVGLLRSVLFLPEDVNLVDGAPGERRRYLDIALCQIDRTYCRALSAYQKVVTQRNSLLKTLRDQGVQATSPAVNAQLGFWDEKLVQHGAEVLAKRQNYVVELDSLARRRHADLTGGLETLQVEYLPSFNFGPLEEVEFRRWKAGELAASDAGLAAFAADRLATAARFHEKLTSRRSRELAAGVTLYGPHRDDLRSLGNGRDLRTYGSRGQQRSAALSLKLAEVEAITRATGTAPLLLLDDVMSELDAQRRRMLLAALDGVEQAILTTTDWDDFSPSFRAEAQCLTVHAGEIQLVASSAGGQG
jgi:DNA replication and repair protein RecF